MRTTTLPLLLSLLPSTLSFIIPPTGFSTYTYTTSSAGKAQCITGTIPVPASALNENILLSSPANQYAVTELFVQQLTVDSTLAATINGGTRNVSGTYNINAKLCYPASASSATASTTILFLIHGIGYASNYWDLATGYSFVDAAATAGYATFSYDRLGTGLSAHPDPIQTVQSPLQVSIAKTLIQLLRAGSLTSHAFSKVAAIGHSYGSIQAVGLAVQYPTLLDAIILQGFSVDTSAIVPTFADFNSAIASQNQPLRFPLLPNGYLVTGSSISNQFAFFTYPNFDTTLFNAIDAAKQTYTLGDVFTLTSVVAQATAFTGPVDVVLGEEDFIFCQGDCTYPTNQAALVKPALFPNAAAGSQYYLVGGTGHAVNAHYNATLAFTQMTSFLKTNGL